MGIPDTYEGGRPSGAVPRPVVYGDYLLLHRVAIGGMAELFLAKSRRPELHDSSDPIALKRILPHMAEDPEFRRMFIDEAKIASRLDHPNIVPIRRLGTVEESLFIAMEFVWGKDLLQAINRFRRNGRRIPAGMAAYVAYNMCGALAYAHDKLDPQGRPLHLVHRDVSPQNVLIGYDGSVKLIDFGIARAATRTTKTQTGVLKGKFGYMSPEQVRGLEIDHRSDLFAVGTCLWEMLTSERLFAGESDFATLERVRNAEFDPPSSHVPTVPRDLEAIVLRALSCDPASRYQSARELRLALQSFLQSEPVPFDVSRLSTWMHHLFHEEMEKERPLTSSFIGLGSAVADEPVSETRSRASSPAVVFRPPREVPGTPGLRLHARQFRAAARGPAREAGPFDELADEPTHIFQEDELERLGSEASAEPAPPRVRTADLQWDAPAPTPGGTAATPRISSIPALDPRDLVADDEDDEGPTWLRNGLGLPGRWVGTAERRWLFGAGVAAAILVAAMVAAILST